MVYLMIFLICQKSGVTVITLWIMCCVLCDAIPSITPLSSASQLYVLVCRDLRARDNAQQRLSSTLEERHAQEEHSNYWRPSKDSCRLATVVGLDGVPPAC